MYLTLRLSISLHTAYHGDNERSAYRLENFRAEGISVSFHETVVKRLTLFLCLNTGIGDPSSTENNSSGKFWYPGLFEFSGRLLV